MDLKFLKSTRFWKLVLIGVARALLEVGIITQPILTLVVTILGGSVVIRTIDRAGEKVGGN